MSRQTIQRLTPQGMEVMSRQQQLCHDNHNMKLVELCCDMENFVMTMIQDEYKTGMLRQTHNKDEKLKDCTSVATNLTKGKNIEDMIEMLRHSHYKA